MCKDEDELRKCGVCQGDVELRVSVMLLRVRGFVFVFVALYFERALSLEAMSDESRYSCRLYFSHFSQYCEAGDVRSPTAGSGQQRKYK